MQLALDLALQIVQALGVHTSEHPAITPVPTADFIHASIEREVNNGLHASLGFFSIFHLPSVCDGYSG
jgi:hypothetical protein